MECNSEKGDDLTVKKELVISLSSSEEGVDVTIRSAGEVENGILFTHEGNKFVINKGDIEEALKELEGFKGNEND